jgi:hypothetical protein
VSSLNVTEELRYGVHEIHVSGPLVDDWPDSGRLIWRIESSALNGLNDTLTASVDHLERDLARHAPADVVARSALLNEYARAVHALWSEYGLDQPSIMLNRQRVAEMLADRGETIRGLAEKDVVGAARAAPAVKFVTHSRTPTALDFMPLMRPRETDDFWRVVLTLPSLYCMWQTVFLGSRATGALIAQEPLSPGLRAVVRGADAPGWKQMRRILAADGRPTLPEIPDHRNPELLERRKVARFILDPYDLQTRGRTVSDVHLYAHGIVGTAAAEKFTIRLPYPGKLGMLLPAGTVPIRNQDFDDAALEAGNSERRRPVLVWMTCCNAAGEVGRLAFSQAVKMSHTGAFVIAPRTEVENAPAQQLAAAFYRHWEPGVSPPHAFLAARLERLAAGDPFPIFYHFLGQYPD